MAKQMLNALLIVSLLLAASAEFAAALSSASVLAQTQSIFTPVADTYVLVTTPNTNYGSRTALKTDGSPLENIYLKFNVQGASAAPSAALQFYAETNSSLGFNVHSVSDTMWNEGQITWNNAPPIGPIVASTGPIQAGNWYLVDVSSAVSGDGLVSFAITNPHPTVATISSKEGSNPPKLYIPFPTSPDPFIVRRDGRTYHAESQTTSSSYSGSLKFVVQSAAYELNAHGGGTITFQAGDFDLGSEWFEFHDLTGITFEGQGIDVTVLRNNASASTDTEPFDFTNGDFITIRDMTVSAGGPLRSTSDALDFDAGDNNRVERVKVTASRGRGIVFDGKDVSNGQPRTADSNVVLDCIITGIPSHGIELLASNSNRIENCQILDVGGHGIEISKSSTTASQPDKKSNDNVIAGNYIDNAGQDGMHLTSGDRNVLTGNTILNSSNNTSSQDGIEITSGSSITCDDNIVEFNTANDNQAVKTQRYGLSISSSNCHRTVVTDNNFSGNRAGEVRDFGTGTIFTPTTTGLLFVDSFESGNFSQWTSVTGLTIQQQQVYAGLFAARGTSTGTPTYAYKQLSQAQSNLYYRLWFKIINQGANQVYLQRFRTATNGAIMGVYVNNVGNLSYRNDVTGIGTVSSTTVTSGVWHELQTRVRINGTSGQTEVWLDGVRIDALSKTENLGTSAIGRIQLGESSSGRTFDIALDRVALGTSFIASANPPEGGSTPPTPTPTIPPTPTSTPTPDPSTHTWFISGIGSFSFGKVNDIPVPADYNGDGKGDIAVFRPSNSTWYISGAGSVVYGAKGDIPVPADYNGDGKADIAVFRPSNSTWYLYGLGDFLYGTVGDIPVVADYNGDGKADIAVFRPSNSTWYIYGVGSIIYGAQGDTPVVADYNGDGKGDIAVFRP